jgi:hypothetical protein
MRDPARSRKVSKSRPSAEAPRGAPGFLQPWCAGSNGRLQAAYPDCTKLNFPAVVLEGDHPRLDEGKAAAIAYTLIEAAKLNGVDPNAWLADALARIPDYKITKVDELLPWRWSR